MSGSTQTRILLADDQALLRAGFASLLALQPDMEVVALAGTGRTAVALYREHRPDVALIDLQMPDGSGIEAVSTIRTFDPAAKLIMLTSYMGEEDVFQAMSAGAKAYFLKDEEPETLFACIRTVAAGVKHISPRIAEKLSDRLCGEPLSEREMAVLDLLAQGQSNMKIAHTLGIAESTVKFHMNNILAKLQVTDRTQAVLAAIRKGLVRVS